MPRLKLFFSSPDENFGSQLRNVLEKDFDIMVSTHLSSILPLLVDEKIDVLVTDQRWELSDGAVIDRVLNHLQQSSTQTLSLALVGNEVPVLLQPHIDSKHVEALSGIITVESVINRLQRCLEQKYAEEQAPVEEEASATASPHASTAEAPKPPPTIVTTGFGEAVFPGITRNFETRSPEMKQMLEDLMVAGSHNVTILLIGETGSGKTFLSNLVHEASPRRDEPFIHVACGALPRDLIESELFGHVKGSFTSAHADKEGKFIAARKGTILLDEIDVLAPEQQVKLLRVIETGEFEPVGSNQTFQSQARLVVASNLDLEPLVEQGLFRPDLYYRLNMMKFELLPLRKRKVDVIPMCKMFIKKFQEKHGIPIHRVDDSLFDSILSYPWPGNVRELEHVMQRAVIYCKDGILSREHLPPNILAGQVGPTNDPSVRLGHQSQKDHDRSLEQKVACSEKEIIEQTLFKNNFSRTNTAKELGISRVTLYNKMKKYNMMK
ncbi:sigma-54 interaction domain-containing protein [Thalassoglobus polymorphus]|uniref:Nitrogen fixation protein VnfA n=1 Tax=Thalassoglobus polymorphus TaxID=2527994 RepID=A0A517QM41_9PLAN|nr:sigma-54 dependent transcriptional regulator [Thalassoglobus polymorphus]QDT32700.1 Nitrogen fixation protein VnfA [Thalassoglobus polymorphus]